MSSKAGHAEPLSDFGYTEHAMLGREQAKDHS
jgi:hypothetical protein